MSASVDLPYYDPSSKLETGPTPTYMDSYTKLSKSLSKIESKLQKGQSIASLQKQIQATAQMVQELDKVDKANRAKKKIRGLTEQQWLILDKVFNSFNLIAQGASLPGNAIANYNNNCNLSFSLRVSNTFFLVVAAVAALSLAIFTGLNRKLSEYEEECQRKLEEAKAVLRTFHLIATFPNMVSIKNVLPTPRPSISDVSSQAELINHNDSVVKLSETMQLISTQQLSIEAKDRIVCEIIEGLPDSSDLKQRLLRQQSITEEAAKILKNLSKEVHQPRLLRTTGLHIDDVDRATLNAEPHETPFETLRRAYEKETMALNAALKGGLHSFYVKHTRVVFPVEEA